MLPCVGTEVACRGELPPSVRFFAGGDQSVRGYDYESLGPADDAGNVIGFDTELVEEMASRLGLEVEHLNRKYGYAPRQIWLADQQETQVVPGRNA